MKRIQCIVKLVIAGIISLFFLSLFVLVFCNTGIHVNNPAGYTDYRWIPNQKKSTMIEGYSWLRMDNNGFNNSFIPDQIDILILGSSHMEAVNVSQSDNSASKLALLIPEKKVYNIGISGHDIYRCANNLRNAVNEFNPTEYIVIETDRVVLEKEKMEMVVNGEMAPIPSYDTGLLFFLQKLCPALKPIYKNIQVWRSASSQNLEIVEREEFQEKDQLISFLMKIKKDCGEGKKLIIVFHPTTTIDEDGRLFFDNHDDVLLFSEVCSELGIVFLDMTDSFSELYSEKHILPYGFINTAVGEGHLNKDGHQMIAERIAEVIRGE